MLLFFITDSSLLKFTVIFIVESFAFVHIVHYFLRFKIVFVKLAKFCYVIITFAM